jgi:hypothetical protein
MSFFLKSKITLATVLGFFAIAQNNPAAEPPAPAPPVVPAGTWIPLFNGTNLEGWTINIAKHPLGENAFNTFRIEDRILKVNYGDYPVFNQQYGQVLRYQRPQLDPRDEMAPATDLLNAGSPLQLSYGHIDLQAEGQPVWFRKIELKSLEEKTTR